MFDAGPTAGGAALNFGFRDNAGKLVVWDVDVGGDIYDFKFTSTTSPSAAYVTLPSTLAFRNPIWLQVSDDGTNIIFRYRLSAADNWVVFDSQIRTNFMGSGPTQIGFGAYVNGNAARVSCFSWNVS